MFKNSGLNDDSIWKSFPVESMVPIIKKMYKILVLSQNCFLPCIQLSYMKIMLAVCKEIVYAG